MAEHMVSYNGIIYIIPSDELYKNTRMAKHL